LFFSFFVLFLFAKNEKTSRGMLLAFLENMKKENAGQDILFTLSIMIVTRMFLKRKIHNRDKTGNFFN